MPSLLAAFLLSFIATLLIIRSKNLHSHISSDSDLTGPQKFHTQIVPRIGGIAIAIGVFFGIILRLKNTPNPNLELILLICAIPTFTIGLIEDLTKNISVRKRLFFTMISAMLFVYLLQAQIVRLDIPGVDLILTIPLVGAILTIFAMTGLANAYNIIDGFNGLASMVAIITLIGIAYVGFLFTDPTIVYLALVMAGAILGFFLFNYPRGLIFLGDGGAYLIGFWIAALTILLTYRHQEISPWFALLINGYPILETLFTIYRRCIHQGKSPGQPDGIHIHTLIYRRILMNNHKNKKWFTANARTSPYLWILSTICVLTSTLCWKSTPIITTVLLIYIIFYIWLYGRIVKFRTPKWLHAQK